MGGGAMWPPVTAAAAGGDTYTRSTSLAANFHSHQSLSAISRPSCIPSSAQSTGRAKACSENMPSFDDENLDPTSFEGRQNLAARKPYFDLGPVPTRMEAEKAMADLLRFIHSETNLAMNSSQSMVSSSEPRMLQSAGYGRGVFPDALNMLQKDPSIQSTVVSISCDKAVWDAILSNRAVQDLRGLLAAAGEEKMQSPSEELNMVDKRAAKEKIQSPNEELDIVDYILEYLTGITKSKVMELIEKLGALVAEIFKPSNEAKPSSELNDLVEEMIRSSMLLSVVILLIVIVTRNE